MLYLPEELSLARLLPFRNVTSSVFWLMGDVRGLLAQDEPCRVTYLLLKLDVLDPI